MHINPAAVRNVKKIGGVLAKLFGASVKVNIGLIGDSTIENLGHGWDHGVNAALMEMGLRRYGTGLHGVGEGSGVGYGHSNTPNTQNGVTAGLPAEWQVYGQNKSGDAGHLGVLDNWFITANQAAGNFGVSLHAAGITGYSRACEFLAEALTMRLWYAVTTNATAGAELSVAARKETGQDQIQGFQIENFDGAIGGTFTITIGSNTTAAITYSTTAATLQTNVKNAIEAANPGVTVGVVATTSAWGAVSVQVTFTAPAATDQAALSVDASGLTARYSGLPVQVSTGVQAANRGFFTAVGSTTVLAADSQASTGVARHDRSVAADAQRDWPIGFQLNKATALAPWVSLFGAIAAADRTAGFALTPMVGVGGQSARVHATRLQTQTDAFLTALLQAMAEHAGYASPATAPLLIRIVGGVNDRSDATLSVGPAPAASNTQAGIYDNWLAIIQRIEQIYINNFWATDNLAFLIVASTPQISGDADLAFARAAANELSDDLTNVAAIDVSQLHDGYATDVTQLASHIGGSPDYAHPNVTGMKVWAAYELGSLRDAYQASLGRGSSVPYIGMGIGLGLPT